ncbi:hypothetical protein CK203_089420 [Vitis vinifera]|uniref:Retroviral polymerase SH3-like domain-containing protein n=1 Tax=Vitis vinifera TaxID=29760 RepID=A0A438E959_VITVI|nr:hypothetical protein CK203_089420 [Vitis vinifera]
MVPKLWLKDRSTGKTIGIGRESQSLYHLHLFDNAGIFFYTLYFFYVPTWDPPSVILCSYSSTKWVAERKNRHLVETARTLLLHSHDKLSAKATKCIFLGCSRLQKGYRCYSPDIHRYFLSADVTFFEDSPFFSSSESLPILKQWLMKWLLCTPMAHGILFLYLLGKSTVGCRWVYTVKVGPDGQVDRLKAAWLLKLCVIDLFISWILRMLSFMVNFSRKCIWSNHLVLLAQGESGLVCKLRRSLYGLKQSPRAWFGHFSSVVQEFGMLWSEADHSVFYHHNSSSQCIYLTWANSSTLGLEIVQSSSGVVMSQRKYVLDILEETGTGGVSKRSWEISTTCRQLNYLTITRARHLFSWAIPKLLVTQMQIGLVHPQIGVPPQGIVFLLEVGHQIVVSYAKCMGVPLFRRRIQGSTR